jgi:hypothetical protein
VSALPRPFHAERRRVATVEGPGPLSGITQATLGADRLFRDARESEPDFRQRVARVARQRGLGVVGIEGLLVVGGRR